MSKKNLAVVIVGDRNAGKSTTWYRLFNRTVATGKAQHILPLLDGRMCKVFLINGSPEERGKAVGKMIHGKPRIVLCSVQYIEAAFETLDHFLKEHLIYCIWLNPGHHNRTEPKRFDDLGMLNYLVARDALVSIRRGSDDVDNAQEIRAFIHGWATGQGLTLPMSNP